MRGWRRHGYLRFSLLRCASRARTAPYILKYNTNTTLARASHPGSYIKRVSTTQTPDLQAKQFRRGYSADVHPERRKKTIDKTKVETGQVDNEHHLDAPKRLLQAVLVGEWAHVPLHDAVVHRVGQKVVAIWAERETCDSIRVSVGEGKVVRIAGLSVSFIHGALYTDQQLSFRPSSS